MDSIYWCKREINCRNLYEVDSAEFGPNQNPAVLKSGSDQDFIVAWPDELMFFGP